MGTATRQGIMLACQADEKNLGRLGEEVFLQPKLNGERCRTVWHTYEKEHLDQCRLLSSYNNPYENIRHINAEVVRLNEVYNRLTGFHGIPLDGELYHHEFGWSKIRSIASRSVNEHDEADTLQYHIFDLRLQAMSQENRFKLLDAIFAEFQSDVIIQVKTMRIDKTEVFKHCESICDEGYEGVIVRSIKALYTPNRTRKLLKYKPTEEDTYEIVEVREALTSGERLGKEMVGAFYVRSDDGVKFKVSAGRMKHTERYRIWGIRDQVIGQRLLVRHEKLRTINGVPLGCVGLSVVGHDYVEKAK